MAKEFRQYGANMGIIMKNVLVEAHHSIGMVKCYYRPLQQVYSIITPEIPGIEPELALQITFKAIHNSMSPNRIVSILQVFDVYPKMNELDALSISIIQCAIAIKKAMNEVRKYIAF